MKIFCPFLVVTNKVALNQRGPALIVANHPNSFLDAIIIGLLCKHPIYFLARGDAFQKGWHRELLGLLHLIPIYRKRDGPENLKLNNNSFQQAHSLLEKGEIVLIFIEGICVNQHQLQSFKKGAARIAEAAKNLAGFRILPVGIAYDSFSGARKSVQINVGQSQLPNQIMNTASAPQNYTQFNHIMKEALNSLITPPQKMPRRTFTGLGMIGWALHYFFYWQLSKWIKNKTSGTVFYDSVLFAVLLIAYPLYLLVIGAILLFIGLPYGYVLLILCLHVISVRFFLVPAENNK